MNLDTTEVQAAYYAVAALARTRRANGQPIPGPVRRLFDRLDHAIREGDDDTPDPRIEDDEIGTAEAALILGCTQRTVQRIATSLDGIRIGRTWIFSRSAVVEYAEASTAA